MLRLKRFVRAAAVLAIAGCSGDARSPVAPGETPSREILDAARSTTVQGFYWLAPLVPQPSFSGTFDPNVSPTVQVCELTGAPPGSTCTGTLVAQFTTAGGTGGQVVTVDPGGELYKANWHTDLSNLDTSKFYRISVFVGATELGHADVDPLNTGRELKNVDTNELIPLVDGRTLPIKFRIETGAGPTQRAPLAQADAYATVENTALTVPDGATDLLANDSLGVPTATVASFGGGSLGGAVTDHAAGGTASFGSGGSLTVNGDGSFAFTPAAGFSGSFSFQYRIASAAGTSDATVTLTVAARPTAMDDAPAATSAPGDAYHAPFNSALSLPAPGILGNDALGSPAATVASFGGGSLGGTVADNAAGSTASFGSSGSLAVNADGSLVFTPAAGFTGLFTFEYRIANSVDSDVGQVTIAVGARPAAGDDAYGPTLIGNVPVNTASSSGFSVRANDAGDGVTLALTSVSGGTVILDLATGTFSFDPAPGHQGAAGFGYSLTNGFGTVTASVSLDVAGVIWFIDNAAPAAGNGTLGAPFNSLAAFNAANDGAGAHPAAGHAVFVHESGTGYTGPLTLLDGQKVVGQDATASLPALTGLTPPADSPLPATDAANAVVVNIVSAANGIDLAQNNALHGLRVGNTTGTGIAGSGFGTLTASDLTVNTTGPALALSGGTLAADFKGVSSSGGARNVDLVNVGGTADLGTGALSGSTAAAFHVDGGGAALSYAGSIATAAGRSVSVTNRTGGQLTLSGTIDDAGQGILAQGNTGGTIAFTGGSKSIGTGANAGVTLAANTGATVNFNGGGLAIATTTGNGFDATGGGTVNVTGLGNTISSAGGTALRVAGSTIGSSGLLFRSISAVGGGNGIVLDGTGELGGLTVSGNGAPGSGGVIRGTAGADGTAAGIGVYLNATRAVNLGWMQIGDHPNFAIRGTGVAGFTLANSLVDGSNGTSSALDEASVAFDGLTGSASVTGTSVSGGFTDNFRVRNSAGTLDRIVFDGVTFGANATATGDDGLSLEPAGSAVMKATVRNSAFTSARGELFLLDARGSAAADLVFTGNTVSNNHPDIVSGGGGVAVVSGGLGFSPTLTYSITNNSFRDARGHGLLLSSAGGTGTMSGTVSGNSIGAAGVANSGSQGGSALALLLVGGGTHTAAVTGNQLRQYNNHGLLVQAGDNTQGGQGALNATVTGNTISNPGTLGSLAMNGIHLNIGTVPEPFDQHRVCAQITGNGLVGSGALGGTDFRIRQRQQTTVRLPGYAGASDDNAAVVAFVQAGNTGSPSGTASNTVSSGAPGFVGGAACQ